jgi:phage terminase large subunit-like protein
MTQTSVVESFLALPDADRTKLLAEMSDEVAAGLFYDWRFWARPNQLPPEGDWRWWLILSGRGWGKSRTGAEWLRMKQEQGAEHMGIIGPTSSDTRDIMIEGISGIMAVCPPWNKPEYEPSKLRITWPNGASCHIRSADEPDRIRGLNLQAAWADEPAAWKYPTEAFDQLAMALRLGVTQAVLTTTPKPIALIRSLMKDPHCVVTRGTTWENEPNLSRAFIEQVVKRYQGTRLGQQELHAVILDDIPGALWTTAIIEQGRVREHPPLVRIVVAIDPAASAEEGSDETGIIVAGEAADGHVYVLEDCTLAGVLPAVWGAQAVRAYHRQHGDRIVGESNNGGDMVEHVIRSCDDTVSYKKVHASRGKLTRAEPVAALYEQGKVHHVGVFPELEEQMTTWVPMAMDSPDRMDALVWAVTELVIEHPNVRLWGGPVSQSEEEQKAAASKALTDRIARFGAYWPGEGR